MAISLSSFFPPNTEYFYSFPAGDDSSFFNNVPAWKEELVAMRPLVCAGSNIKVVTFAATQADNLKNIIREIGLPIVSSQDTIILPSKISALVHGQRRNNLIKSALRKQISKGRLIMAQPFLDKKLADLYQFDPRITVWFNDKKNIPDYINKDFLPKRFCSFKSGADFAKWTEKIQTPCVIKVSSSSSGDGVRICRTAFDIQNTKKAFSKLKGSIIVEEFIYSVYNLGVQFGIPYDKKQPIEIIGHNEQLVSSDGEYLGAIVNLNKKIGILAIIYKTLLEDILPKVRERGWYGVGGFDVLVDKNNKFYFIDSNFRMTAMTSYLYLIKNGVIKNSIACFTGIFKGGEDKFREVVMPLVASKSKEKCLHITSISKVGGCYHFNAAMFFDLEKNISVLAKKLLSKGIKSKVLTRFSKEK